MAIATVKVIAARQWCARISDHIRRMVHMRMVADVAYGSACFMRAIACCGTPGELKGQQQYKKNEPQFTHGRSVAAQKYPEIFDCFQLHASRSTPIPSREY